MGMPSATFRSHVARRMKYSSSPKKLPNGTRAWSVRNQSPAMAASRARIATRRIARTRLPSSAGRPSPISQVRDTKAIDAHAVSGDSVYATPTIVPATTAVNATRRGSPATRPSLMDHGPKHSIVRRGNRRQREPLSADPRAQRQSLAKRCVRQHPRKGGGQRVGLVAIDEQAVIADADDLARPRRRRGDHGDTARQGFDDNVAETFVARAQRENIRVRDVLPRIALEPAENHCI